MLSQCLGRKWKDWDSLLQILAGNNHPAIFSSMSTHDAQLNSRLQIMAGSSHPVIFSSMSTHVTQLKGGFKF